MLSFYHKVPDFNPVSGGQKASVRLPTGYTYRELNINYVEGGTAADAATIAANVLSVALKINGKTRFELTGAELLMLNAYYGNAFNDGEIIIPLSRHWARQVAFEEFLAWGTADVDTFFLEVKLAATATAPELKADASVTPERRPLGRIVEVHSFPYDFSGGGKKEISDLPKGNGNIVAMHLKNANITNVEVSIDKTPFIEDETNLGAYQNLLARQAGRVVQDGYTHIDAISLNRFEDNWPVANAQDFRVKPTLGGTGQQQVNIIMETLSTPLGLPA